MTGSPLVTLDEVRAAAARLTGIVPSTPVRAVSSPAGVLTLKCEHQTPVGAFKLRGAFNLVTQLAAEGAVGVVAYSSGNHAQAVAHSAHLIGIPAVVVMPTTAPAVKVEGTRRWGADVILDGTTSLERQRRAEAEARARGFALVPPFDDRRIVAGTGTIGLEIVEQVPEVETVFVPVGGGGLLAGVAVAVKALRPGARIIGVEPVGSAAMAASLRAGHPVTLDRTSSIADGLLPLSPGVVPFAHAKALVDDIHLVGDDAILEALRWIFDATGMVVEPSGAVGVAAALAARPGTGAVAVLSGGNVDPRWFAAAVGDGPFGGTFPNRAPSETSETTP